MTTGRVIDYLRYDVDYFDVVSIFFCAFALAIGSWVVYAELCKDEEKEDLQPQAEHELFIGQLKSRLNYSGADYSDRFKMVATPGGMRPLSWDDD